MKDKPLIVCLCGSTKFKEKFEAINRIQTLAGCIVLAPGVFAHAGDPITDEEKKRLDELHLRKIDMADHVAVVCPGGYIGESTAKEIEYATKIGKTIGYWED